MARGEPYPFDWAGLVPQVVHPLKVAIIEAFRWINQPISPSELQRVFAEEFGLATVAYHVNTLVELGVLVKVAEQPIRGSIKTFVFFPGT